MRNFKCFLASSSAEGFVSYFGTAYDPFDGWKAYIIKGGPGTGKSSFMKKVASHKAKNIIEVCCASDPSSLDALIISDQKTIIMDGTSPHITDPVLPGVSETLLDFGRFWESELLNENSAAIARLTKENKHCHKTAAKYIHYAGDILKNQHQAESSVPPIDLIPFSDGCGTVHNAFIGGITPDGLQYFTESIPAKNRLYVSNEEYLRKAAQLGKNHGYDVVVFKNPILPSTFTDGIYIPKLSLLICNKIIAFNDEVYSEFLRLAAQEISHAKKIHDELERLYIAAMDFNALDAYCEQIIKQII